MPSCSHMPSLPDLTCPDDLQAILDVYVWLPNGVGLLLSLAQLLLRGLFPATPHHHDLLLLPVDQVTPYDSHYM